MKTQRRRRTLTPAGTARKIARLEQLATQLEQHVVGESWHQRADRMAQADRYRAQAFRLGRYLPREPEPCDLPF